MYSPSQLILLVTLKYILCVLSQSHLCLSSTEEINILNFLLSTALAFCMHACMRECGCTGLILPVLYVIYKQWHFSSILYQLFLFHIIFFIVAMVHFTVEYVQMYKCSTSHLSIVLWMGSCVIFRFFKIITSSDSTYIFTSTNGIYILYLKELLDRICTFLENVISFFKTSLTIIHFCQQF